MSEHAPSPVPFEPLLLSPWQRHVQRTGTAPRAAMIVADVLPEPMVPGHPTRTFPGGPEVRHWDGALSRPLSPLRPELLIKAGLLSYGEKPAVRESLLFPFMVCVTFGITFDGLLTSIYFSGWVSFLRLSFFNKPFFATDPALVSVCLCTPPHLHHQPDRDRPNFISFASWNPMVYCMWGSAAVHTLWICCVKYLFYCCLLGLQRTLKDKIRALGELSQVYDSSLNALIVLK